MSRTTGGIIVVVVAIAGLSYYFLTQPAPGPPINKLTDIPEKISVDPSGLCTPSSMPDMPANAPTGDTITWSEENNLAYVVTFAAGSAVDPGTPFTDTTGSRKTTISSPGTPFHTGGTSRTRWQKLWGITDFHIQTISVNGNPPCYDRGKNPMEPMKVIVNP